MLDQSESCILAHKTWRRIMFYTRGDVTPEERKREKCSRSRYFADFQFLRDRFYKSRIFRMRLLACLATAVCGNLVATLYHQELPSYSARLMNQADSAQTLYYALDAGKEPYVLARTFVWLLYKFSLILQPLESNQTRTTRVKL